MSSTPAPRAGIPRPVPTGTLLIREISHLATLNKALGELKNAAVYVKGNIIQWVGKDAEIPAEYLTADRVVSMKGCIVIPGMVNTHAHMFQALTKCVAQDKQLHGWLKSLYPIWQYMKGEDVYASTKLSMVELILTGCTCSSDHLYMYPNDVTLDDTIRAAREVGLRFHAVRGGMSAGVSKGGIPPDHVVEEEDDILADMRRCIEAFHDNAKYSMLRVAVGPSSQKSVTRELMERSAVLAREYPGVRLHTHLAENPEDIEFITKSYGYRFKEYITSVGWDKSDCWFAHCCMLNEDEQAMFAANGIGIAHCPSSNTRLASGICPVRRMLDVGVNVGLGVDGSSSNDSQHMLAEARLALLLQRANANVNGLSAREALWMACKGGARNLGRDDVGEVAPGMAADIVAWCYEGNLGFAGCAADPLAGLLLCAPSIGNVDFSCINGEVVVLGGKLLTADIATVVEDANVRSARLLEQAKYSVVLEGKY